MRQNSKNRFNARYNNRGHRPQMIFRNTALDSNGPAGKLHGTALQLFEKYQIAAKDAQIQNDAVLSETYLQYADHYMRLQNQAILNEESLRTQNMPRRSENKAEAVVEEVQECVADAESVKTEDDKTTKEDKALKEMDLSVPIMAIQENNDSPKPAQKTRNRRGAAKKDVAKA